MNRRNPERPYGAEAVRKAVIAPAIDLFACQVPAAALLLALLFRIGYALYVRTLDQLPHWTPLAPMPAVVPQSHL